ncbi:hypothetical protein JCM24511_08164 [Saitozyma sp. JCM 24511]|nr:hypothetical protein JCM24511_08164 [Saitozyma sp. JCM 24511]
MAKAKREERPGPSLQSSASARITFGSWLSGERRAPVVKRKAKLPLEQVPQQPGLGSTRSCKEEESCRIRVACKVDLRDDSKTIQELARMNQGPVPLAEGLAVAQKIDVLAITSVVPRLARV